MNATDSEILVAENVSNLFNFKTVGTQPETSTPSFAMPELDSFWNIVKTRKSKKEDDYSLIQPGYHKAKYTKEAKTTQQQEVLSYLNSIEDPDTSAYLTHLAYLESRFKPSIKNEHGYVGAFQFGNSALQSMIDRGIIDQMDKTDFQYAPVETQATAAIGLANLNWKILKSEAEKHLGEKINGVKITKKGLMAAAHLVGVSDVKKWLRTNGQKTAEDANGTTIEKYVREFQFL